MSQLIEGKFTQDSIFTAAEKTTVKKTDNSRILDRAADDKVPKYRLSELKLGRVLGRGYFCAVNEVTQIHLSSGGVTRLDDERVIHNIVQDRPFMAAHCKRDNECRYAVKQLQTVRKEKATDYIGGLTDLAMEARFLAVIRHPNIIKMRAVGLMGPFSQAEPYFLVLDRLYDTMTVRLGKWKKKGGGALRMMAGEKKRKAFWVERLEVAFDLGAALAYLHDKHIMYRDLKPDNIGFDVRGDVKLFDFGLAKELHPHQRRSDGTFLLTEDTVAPEVALGQPYSETADVYSLCILLWQMLSLEPPFQNFTMPMLTKSVYRGGLRPKCSSKWSPLIQRLFHQGWHSVGQQRPSMVATIEMIRAELSNTTGSYYSGTDADQSAHSQHGNNRSTSSNITLQSTIVETKLTTPMPSTGAHFRLEC